MLGLIPFTLFYVLLRGFYALEDTRTPFFITVIFSAVLLALLVPIFGTLNGGVAQISFIALCYSVSYWVGLIVAWIILARRVKGMESGRLILSIGRMMLAGIFSFIAMIIAVRVFNSFAFDANEVLNYSDKGIVLLRLLIVSSVGLIIYIVAAWIVRVPEINIAWRVISAKLGRKVKS
jgi:putative peptidoglycan lipid II flippase